MDPYKHDQEDTDEMEEWGEEVETVISHRGRDLLVIYGWMFEFI